MVRKRSPLSKRYARDLKNDFGKYAVIFMLLMISISFTSGYIVAGDSMVAAYNESFSKYNIEHGHFLTQSELNESKRRSISELGINIYDLYYADKEVKNHGVLRIFADREEVNLVCLMSGELPAAKDEIAIDRMYAVNNSLGIGDEIEAGDDKYRISGLIALPDYSALFQDNSDMMFDASLFGVAVVTKERFAELDKLKYCYAWKYQDYDGSEQEKDVSDRLMKSLNKQIKLDEYVPRYLNHAISFTGDDLGGDRAGMEVFLYIITVIIAFVYAITTRDTIEKESAVIGTLRATGYTKSELIRHYMVMPVIITLVSALIGNILGYSFFKDICANLYYNSYSLITYTTLWSAEAFLRTTLIPIVLMGSVTYLVLRTNLSKSPLSFMRRDIGRKKKKSTLRLGKHIPFINRFRIRIILQNLPNYSILFLGILFANILLLFGFLMPSLTRHQSETITESMLAKHQYILSIPESALDDESEFSSMIELLKFSENVETETEGAEKFSSYTLKTVPEGKALSDEIMIYGIKPGSAYVSKEMADGEVYISSLAQDKYLLRNGESIKLKEPFDDDEYIFKIAGVYEYEGALALFMNESTLKKTFDLPSSFFTGYFSDNEIKDIDDEYIGTVIDYDSLTKVSRQLMISMGSFMRMLDIFAVVLSVILIYLLSKIIIEKNAQSISMVKILGYTNSEIGRLYITATTIMVFISMLCSLYLSKVIIIYLWRTIVINRISGWIGIYFDRMIYLKMMTLGMGAYAVVAALEMRKIRRIPMNNALKNIE